MITDAIKAADALLRAVPLLQGSGSQQDYREALELVEYLLENDEHHPLIDMLAKKIAGSRLAPSTPAQAVQRHRFKAVEAVAAQQAAH